LQPTDKHLRKSNWAASCLAYAQFSQASHNPLSTHQDILMFIFDSWNIND
jgi:hypothetical protein